jgi:hypothetical protein
MLLLDRAGLIGPAVLGDRSRSEVSTVDPEIAARRAAEAAALNARLGDRTRAAKHASSGFHPCGNRSGYSLRASSRTRLIPAVYDLP